MGKLYLFYLLWVHRHTVTLSSAFHINWRHNVLQLIVTLILLTLTDTGILQTGDVAISR